MSRLNYHQDFPSSLEFSNSAKRQKSIKATIKTSRTKILTKEVWYEAKTTGTDFNSTVKPVLSGHSKIDKTKVLKTDVSLMQVRCIAECSLGAFCNTFDLH